MKNEYNIELKEHKHIGCRQGFNKVVAGLILLNKKIDDLSCDDFKALYNSYTCKQLKAMRKLEKGLAL